MGSHTVIRIREKSYAEDVFTLIISFREANGSEEEMEVILKNPYDAHTSALMEWYFEEYISTPYDDVKVKDAVNAIEQYGIRLFQDLFMGTLDFYYRTTLQRHGPEKMMFEIVGDSTGFQSIYWESLRDPRQAFPLAVQGALFSRKNTNNLTVKATVRQSTTINLLIVTARPNEENDVNYRTIQRPLIDLIDQTDTPIRPHILRPGTYEALIRHMDEKAGYYHIIHFDLHGSLLDYETYLAYQGLLTRDAFKQVLYKSSYGLKELTEEDFEKGKKAFIFFESEEKGVAVPVDARQLADFLENKQIPICILNACQSAKQENSAHETSLGRALIQKGIQLIVAMQYSVSVTAAKIMMEKLYQQLYQQKPIDEAVAAGRKELFRIKERKAIYNYTIELEDWLLPIVYQNSKPDLQFTAFTPEEEIAFFREKQIPEDIRQEFPYGFFGRDLDILKIEKNLLTHNNILLLQGMGGAGKTTLLKYLSGWWLRTGFIQYPFYFGYDTKPYTLNEIIHHIARKIYQGTAYSTFAGLPADVQHNRIAKVLLANRYVLILDNAESITGEKLAIPNTLPPEERKSLKTFISSLKGGRSFVLVGSRANEDWLKDGTFETNTYLLKGLDTESATDFAYSILHSIHITTTEILGNPKFQRLMKLLAGYPLALKAILPNLKHKTPERILEEVEEGVSTLDSGNLQQRTESIIKCIEYSHSNLSEDAQNLLLCLAPFQSAINVDPGFINHYFDELQKEQIFRDFPFDKLQEIVEEATQNGFMQEATVGQGFRFMNLQPAFTYFLRNKLQTKSNLFKVSLQNSFINYYKDLSIDIFKIFEGVDSNDQQVGLFLLSYEYDNWYHSLQLALDQGDLYFLLKAMDGYLAKKRLYQQRLQLAQMVYEKIKTYDLQKLTGESVRDYLGTMETLGLAYQSMNQWKVAYEVFKQLLDFSRTNPYLIDNSAELNIGHLCLKLGTALYKQKHYNEAKKNYEEALRLFISKKDIQGEGIAYMNLGAIAKEQQDDPTAEVQYRLALRIAENRGDIHMQGEIYLNLGNSSLFQRHFPEATGYYEKALAMAIQEKDRYNQARVYESLGSTALAQNDFSIAMEYLEKALDIFVQFQDSYRQSRVYDNLGRVAIEMEETSLAKNYLKKAFDIYEQHQDTHSQGMLYMQLLRVTEIEKTYALSQEYYEKSLAILEQFEDLYNQAKLHINMSSIFFDQKDYVSSIRYQEKALPIYVQYKNLYEQCNIYENLGLIYRKQKEYEKAKEYYNKAIDLFLQSPQNGQSFNINEIYIFSKESGQKEFGITMLQKIIPFYEGADKSYLLETLEAINHLP